ncbi:putative SWEET sugar transporter [Helianthus annuus]|uniref:Bidirectional sugar transporter SWEET n=1 Tax=Helianthus annuus TaxID=4232 RepID=A0A251US43_HELAN|nr:putative SWEET sugar transporter [Helianthus annuus]KAJ0585652.1 putative SWEET sugar transporter [Helianthus annuus]KAJ0923890.1 putative SWEET sugar transporter [Helianthus annuus]
MDHDQIRLIVGIIGNAIALYLFLSPTPTFLKIVKLKSVQAYKPDTYLATLMNCSMWLFYGLPIVHPHSLLVVTINSAGILITLTFCSIFFIYSSWTCRRKMIIVLILEAIVIAAMVTVTLTLSHTHPARSMLVGILCLVFNIIMYASPLTIMKTVIRTKSVKYMPVCISIGNLLNGSIWVVYAALEFDPFIMIPNAVGAVSGMIQIGLYVKYYKTTNWSDDQSPNEIEMPPSASNA